MPCFVLKTGHKVRSWCLFPMEWWVRFELRNRSSVPYFNGLVTVSAMKETKRRYFLLPSTKETTKKSIMKDIDCLGPYFTWLLSTGKLKHVIII